MIKLLLLMLEIISFGLVSLGSVTSTYSYEETPAYDHKTLITLETQFEELNGHTLSEVFEGGNYLYNKIIVNGSYYSSTGSVVTNALSQRYNEYFDVSINDYLYTNKSTVLINNYDSSLIHISRTTMTTKKFQNIVAENIRLSQFDNGLTYFNETTVLINQTSLGIDTLTVEEMDFYYSLYQDCVNNVDNYIYTTYDFTPSEITLNHILIIALSLGLWYVIFKLIRGLLP